MAPPDVAASGLSRTPADPSQGPRPAHPAAPVAAAPPGTSTRLCSYPFRSLTMAGAHQVPRLEKKGEEGSRRNLGKVPSLRLTSLTQPSPGFVHRAETSVRSSKCWARCPGAGENPTLQRCVPASDQGCTCIFICSCKSKSTSSSRTWRGLFFIKWLVVAVFKREPLNLTDGPLV